MVLVAAALVLCGSCKKDLELAEISFLPEEHPPPEPPGPPLVDDFVLIPATQHLTGIQAELHPGRDTHPAGAGPVVEVRYGYRRERDIEIASPNPYFKPTQDLVLDISLALVGEGGSRTLLDASFESGEGCRHPKFLVEQAVAATSEVEYGGPDFRPSLEEILTCATAAPHEPPLPESRTYCLEAALGSEHWSDRMMSLHGLARLGSWEKVREALSDPHPRVRWGALWLVAGSADPAYREALHAALEDSSPEVRGLAAWLLGAFDDDGTVKALIALLEDDSVIVRSRAATTLGRIGDGKAVPALAQLLEENQPDVRLAAIRALAEIGGDGAVEPLVAVMLDEKVTGPTEGAAADALIRIQSKKTPGLLMKMLGGQTCMRKAERIGDVLSGHWSKKVEKFFTKLLDGPSPGVAVAFRVFSKRRMAGKIPLLLEAMDRLLKEEESYEDPGDEDTGEAQVWYCIIFDFPIATCVAYAGDLIDAVAGPAHDKVFMQYLSSEWDPLASLAATTSRPSTT